MARCLRGVKYGSTEAPEVPRTSAAESLGSAVSVVGVFVAVERIRVVPPSLRASLGLLARSGLPVFESRGPPRPPRVSALAWAYGGEVGAHSRNGDVAGVC